jgi:hypothetical protein
LQFKDLCENNYFLCKDEYALYKEWTQIIEARLRYINIMSSLITDKMREHGTMTKIILTIILTTIERKAFFLAHHQMLAYHQWLSFCPEEAALFCNFKLSKSVCLASIIMKMSLKEFSLHWYPY